jgi:hypothetical protein
MFKHANVKRKTCIHPDCKTQPSFNKEGESTALYCSSHKWDGMVNVISKTCIHPDCKIRPPKMQNTFMFYKRFRKIRRILFKMLYKFVP